MPQASVATYNIRHGRGLDDRVDLERIAREIRATGADLVALQELDRFHPRSDRVDQPAELERLTGYHITFRPTVADGGREYGIAIASRSDEIGNVASFDLPRVGDEEPRRVLTCRWRGLTVFATHLAVERLPNRVQLEALAAAVAPELPGAVVVGDLNSVRVAPLRRTGLKTARAPGGTVAPRWRLRQIDHVLAAPPVALGRARRGALGASDHRSLTVSLSWSVEDVLTVTYDV